MNLLILRRCALRGRIKSHIKLIKNCSRVSKRVQNYNSATRLNELCVHLLGVLIEVAALH